jgi:hypothetical protein
MLNRLHLGTRVAAVCLVGLTAGLSAPRLAASSSAAELGSTAAEAAAPVAASTAAAPMMAAFDPASWAAAPAGLNPDVFALALRAAAHAVERGDASGPSTLTVIDFSQPSTAKRMWVVDLRSHAVLFHEYVAHGRGTGENLATAFSNTPESNRSSLGLFRTGEAYIGKHGLSLRLDGLEPGVNDRARERAIVIHGADYVNPAAALAQGRLGRSLGCPAVRPEVATPLIQAVKNGGLLFAYYPQQSWLSASSYL